MDKRAIPDPCDLAETSNRYFPRLLLHSCCAPCSSHVISVLSADYSLTVFYFNPNIYPFGEYEKRKNQQLKLLTSARYDNPVSFIDGDYNREQFTSAVKGLEQAAEGGARCRVCFTLRLSETARTAKLSGFDIMATTLSVSPRKDAAAINEIGSECAKQQGIAWLSADFKKDGGWQNSVALSKRYGLYRQRYCGCEHSLRIL